MSRPEECGAPHCGCGTACWLLPPSDAWDGTNPYSDVPVVWQLTDAEDRRAPSVFLEAAWWRWFCYALVEGEPWTMTLRGRYRIKVDTVTVE